MPEAQLGGHPVVEPVDDGAAVGALGGGGEAEEVARPDVVKEAVVGGGAGQIE